MLYNTKHLIAYAGGGKGGYVYFYKERLPGWYRWNRRWGRDPTYAYIDDGIVTARWSGDVEYMGVLPDNYDEYDWVDDEDENLECSGRGLHTIIHRKLRLLWTLREQGSRLLNVEQLGSLHE